MSARKNSVWITWEDHRRSRELSKAIGSEYVCLTYKGSRLARYFILSIKTILTIYKAKPNLVFCQNPSIVLNYILAILKKPLNYNLVSDRHSNFKFEHQKSKNIKWVVFNYLSKITLIKSDLVIVTNEYLKKYIEELGGRAVVLEDKLPQLQLGSDTKLAGETNFVFISTFSDDEPILEIAEVASQLPSSMMVYVTGSYKKFKRLDTLRKIATSNLILTGYLPEPDYQTLLKSADIIVVITNQEHTLTCGAYEAVELEKPMVLSNTYCIRSYFDKGAIYSTPDYSSLIGALHKAANNKSSLKEGVKILRMELIHSWNSKFDDLCQIIEKF